MVNYRLSQDADNDLYYIFDYGIDQFGLERAQSYVNEMKWRFSEIAENPYLWQAVESIGGGYRRSVYGSHSIYYRIEGETVQIIRILGKQNYKHLK